MLLVHDRHACLQAVMELGATVCTPTNPACSSCSLSEVCQAYQQQQRHLTAGGGIEDAPLVTQYPCKARLAAEHVHPSFPKMPAPAQD